MEKLNKINQLFNIYTDAREMLENLKEEEETLETDIEAKMLEAKALYIKNLMLDTVQELAEEIKNL